MNTSTTYIWRNPVLLTFYVQSIRNRAKFDWEKTKRFIIKVHPNTLGKNYSSNVLLKCLYLLSTYY